MQLTVESAKAYVTDYYKALPDYDARTVIEAATLSKMQDTPVVRVAVTCEPSGEIHLWDVWSEPLMGGALYGEF